MSVGVIVFNVPSACISINVHVAAIALVDIVALCFVKPSIPASDLLCVAFQALTETCLELSFEPVAVTVCVVAP